MVAADTDQGLARGGDLDGLRFHPRQHVVAIAIAVAQIAVIDRPESFREGEIPGPAPLFPAQVGARLAHGVGPAARPGSAGGTQVIGYTHDHGIDAIALEIPAQGQAEIAENIDIN